MKIKILLSILLISICLVFSYFVEFFPETVSQKPKNAIRLATWNVSNFGWIQNYSAVRRDSILAGINELDADIVCLQEAVLSYESTMINNLGYVIKQLDMPYYAYCHLRSEQFDDCHMFGDIILAKYPIIHTDSILLGNGSRKYFTSSVLIGSDTLSITNVHLMSNGIDHKEIQDMALISMYKKYKQNTTIRESDISAIIQKAFKDEKSIIAGDFNDLAISKTYKIANGSFTDAYAKLGKGPASTLNKGFLKLRIDYIFFGANIKGEHVEVANLKGSDHRPLIMDFNIRSVGKKILK